MAEITRLVEILRAERDSARKDRLRLDSIKPGLQRFNCIVRFGTVDSGDGKIQLEHWSREQIETVLAIARLIVFSSISATVEQVDPTVVAVIESTIEFCICLLERSECDDDDLSLQNEVVLFLEATLTESVVQNLDGLCNHLFDDFLKSLPDCPNDTGHLICNNPECHWQDSTCLNNKNPMKRVIVSLATECLQAETPVSGFAGRPSSQLPNDIITLVKYFGVVHAKCLPRLLSSSIKLLEFRASSEEMSMKNCFNRRSSFIIKVLKVLGILTRDIPYVPFDFDLMNAVICFGDSLVALFRNEFEFIYSDVVTSTDTLDNQLLVLLEEFIQLVKIVFCDGSVFWNIQMCVIAKMLDILDSKVWRYNSLASCLRTPLAYSPKVIMYLVKLIKDVKCQTKTFMWNEKFGTNPTGFSFISKIEGSIPSWNILSDKVNLLKKCTPDEHLGLLFSPSKHWLDDFINLAYFFHSEGLKLRLKMNGVRSSPTKSVNSDADSTLIHEDEALFGDLFSEANRSVGPDSRLEQTDIDCSSSTYSNQHMLTHVVTELLVFLKVCCFNPEWSRDVYEIACRMFNENHVNYLTSILSCQRYPIDGSARNAALCSQVDVLNINQVCFELLYNLVVQNVLSSALEEHFVDQVLRIENGKYVYNEYSLTLLAHVLFARDGSSVSQLTTKVYENFVNFIMEKSTSSLSNYVDLKDFVGFLPCVFHLELLLMAFHLSNDSEKARIAGYVLHSLKGLSAPPAEYSAHQLSLWGLLASRLILIVHHFVLYPSGCPPWLYVKFRSTLSEAPPRVTIYNHPNDHPASWTMTAAVGIMGDQMKDLPVTSILFPYLIDFSLFSSTAYADDEGFQNLGLSCTDILTSFAWLLCFWSGKKADMLEDLIIERYVFLLCWDTFSIACSRVGDMSLLHIDSSKDDSLSTKSFFLFGQLLLRNNSIVHEDLLPRVVNDLFQQVHCIEAANDTARQGWDMLRNGAWLSLVLSLLHSGLWVSSVKNSVCDVEPYVVEPLCRNKQFLILAESAIEIVLLNNQGRRLVDILSTCLKISLQAFQEAFICIFDDRQTFGRGFSPCLLLKHTVFDRNRQDELLEKCGYNSSKLDSVLSLLSKLEEISKEGNNRSIISSVSRSLLHGFPSHPQTSSATLVSSALNVQDIVCVLDCLFNLKGAGADVTPEKDASHLLWQLVMKVKSDMCFQNIHEKCEAILSNLYTPMDKQLDYGHLFQLKQIEGFLRDITSEDVSDFSTLEMLVIQATESIEALRRDQSREKTFKFYLGAAGASEEDELLSSSHHGDLLVMINALDQCPSESINIKVLNFFVDLLGSSMPCPQLNDRVLEKFISFDLTSLSKWLEVRLLGNTLEESGKGTLKGTSSSLREATMTFLMCLVSLPCEALSEEFHHRLVDAMLVHLDCAFIKYDIYTAKSYFNFIIQLVNGKPMLKNLLEAVILLIQNLAEHEASQQALKFLIGFLGIVLQDCGATKNILGKHPGKLLATFSSASEGCRQLGSKKNTETLVLSASQEAGSVSIDCDATSVDEDEEDGTSDGELASIDKDEEDNNSEKTLASKVCTFTSSGSNFMEQHWYFCYTCDLTVSKGCCSVCAKVCHRGHRVVYSRFSRFFCDCGAGGVRGNSCQCLKPRKFTGSCSSTAVQSSNTLQTFLPLTDDGEEAPDSDSDLDDDHYADIDGSLTFSVPKMVQDGIVTLLQELCVEDWLLQLCDKLLPLVFSRRDAIISKDRKIVLEGDKVLSHKVDMFQLKKAYKSGSFDLKIRADYSNSRELKGHITNGSLTKSLLTVSSRGRLAVAEGDKVSIFDVGQLIGQSTATPVVADKSNIKHLSKNIVRFEIVHLLFNNIMENYLVVAGYAECQVLTVNPRGEVTDRLAIELALQGAYIRRVDWVPGSQVQLLVVTNMFIKIYDLSQDNISPMHYFTLADDSIVDATLIVVPMGRLFLIVLSEVGNLFRLELSVKGDVGAKLLEEIVEVPKRGTQAKGHSLYFSPSHRLLFLSYQDGTTLIGRFDTSATLFTEISALYENENDGKLKPAALHHWNDLLVDNGLFVSFSSLKQNAAVAISLRSQELFAQNLRHTGGSPALQLVGITAYKPLSKDKAHCLVLQEDGSLQIYLHTPFGADASLSMSSDLGKRIGVGILSNKAYAGTKPEFPLDFFEKTTCITTDIKLSGEAIKNSDSEGAKQKLTSDEGFLESPSPAGFKITVLNSNPDIVMVGFRLHVGNTSASHIPSAVTVFQRVIKLDEGMRSWYDIPFTIIESLVADEEFTITVCSTFNGSTSPRIDCLEVYGRAKDEFGWKEKMDAFLDMEADMLGSNSGTAGTKKRYYPIKNSPIEEQLLADALKLLSKIYFLRGPHTCLDVEEANLELNELKCKKILEMIFEGDREAFLQSAACQVLQALFPKKEIYYHVKDTMRLFGVLRSSPTLVSKLGISSSAASWVIKYFIAKTRTVTKIALLRRPNLASFLETNGSGVVDGLMQVFWGILDYEQSDTQIINSIVIPCVELIYSYAECLALSGLDASGSAIIPAVRLLKELLFAPYEAVQTSSSLAISSRLLQVPFPKQMMLDTEEVAKNPSTLHMHPDVASHPGRNAQVVTEEDSTLSSVQYCCDGCSTVPILRRRWHCNVCPDFDLCEACYEVMDADRLPPPHSSDHHMSAIPIENDNIGGDSSEFRFSLDELNDANLAQFSEDTRQQNASTPAHALESSETGEFPASAIVHSVVSISASKRAVNSLLLRQLIYELRGWMKTTSGTRAIPLMQFFYRISSAVGGPFMDSSKPENLDLEKFVKWFLDEIDLNKPFLAKSRTFFGETSILMFMFLTLMLRNWHQPGSDSSQLKSDPVTDTHDKGHVNTSPSFSSPSSKKDHDKDEFASQLARACSYLRQQALVNYLMDILQQFVPHFKSSDTNAEGNLSLPSNSGCGSLLVVRRELPAGNFSPFFSDSYAKAHRSDLFVDFHKLLLENTFKLLYSLVRPEKHEKSVEKDKGHKTYGGKDLKLDGYQDVLCSYISNQHTVFVRRYARRLFLHLCGSKSHYYSVRDSWQISNEVKKLYKLVDKSGGFQNAVPYERSVKLVKCLSAIAEIAGARPRNWQKYCSKHGDFLCFIMEGIFHLGEETVVQTLKLLNFALFSGKDTIYPIPKPESRDAGTSSSKVGSQSSDSKKKKKGEDGNEANAVDKCLDMEHAVEIFFPKGGENLKLFIDTFLLEWNSTSVRMEAKCVLYGAWNHSKRQFRETLVSTLLEKIKVLPMYGQNIVEYTELLSLLLEKVLENAKQQDTEMITLCLTPDVINSICKTLHLQNELLANHPNSRIYNTLSSLVEFDGYYLESEPCVACSCPEVPYSRMKLETLKFETKFTDNRIIVKCTGSYTIQSMIMNVHDARKSKAVKVLNLYYNNRPVSDLSELKNNWSLWKRAKSCHLTFNQTELKVDFPIPITACNFMIELDSFYENLQASSQEALQCPRCSRSVTDKHGICSNCHENAYQCRQCRNINYENLDSFLCNECGYSKYGRFEFNFMARPSFLFDSMENDDDMKKGLAAIESESENAHRRYQQLMGFKKPLLKLVSSIGEQEIDSQHKDTVQQMMVSMPGPSCKINRKIALLGVLYGEKCKAAFDSLNKSVQTLQGLRRVLMNYLQQKRSGKVAKSTHIAVSKSSNNCYGCAITFVSQCMELLRVLSKHPNCKKQFVTAGILSELFENNIHQGPKSSRAQARVVLCAFSEGDSNALAELNSLIQKKVMYCLEHHRSMDISVSTREELFLLSEVCAVVDEFWEARLRVAFHLLFASIRLGSRNPAISEQIILPCLRIISQVCNPPKTETHDKEQVTGRPVSTLQSKSEDPFSSSLSPIGHGFGTKTIPEYKSWDGFEKGQEISLMSYSEWVKGASYLDFIRRHYKIAQNVKSRTQRVHHGSHRSDYLALKYGLKWKRTCSKRTTKSGLTTFELGSWVSELVLSPCSQSIRAEVCGIISLLYTQNAFRQFQLLNLLMLQLPDTLAVGESSAEYFELFSKMLDSHTARLFLTAKGCLATICRLITQEVGSINSQEASLNIDISQGFVLNKLVELLTKFLEVSIIRQRFMREELLSQVLESLLVIRGLIVQKTKLISDCTRLLKDLLDGLLVESSANKRQFIRACVSGLQIHGKEKEGRTCLFILEQLCNLICPSKPEPVYLLILNKAHTQEEFIRGSMTKNPYSSIEIGPLMRDVKNKICHQLDLLGLVEDDYGMELLVAGNIISLDLTISQVYEQVWKKCQNQTQSTFNNTLLTSGGLGSSRDCSPMTITYRLQGLDGEATEPMIKELEEEREESQDPEVEFAIAGAVREFGGLEIILSMIQNLRDDELKSNQEELSSVLNLLMYCCKIRENRRALLRMGALGLLLEIARRAFSVDAMEPAEGILLIVESLTVEANESDMGTSQSVLAVGNEEAGAGEQAKKIVLMFLERLCHSSGLKKSNKQQRNDEMVARILPCLTYGEPAAMDALIQHFDPYLHDWVSYDQQQKKYQDNAKDENLVRQACQQKSEVENFVRVSESLNTSSCGERLKDIILHKGITAIAVGHLRESFAFIEQPGFKTSAEWKYGLSLPSVPVILPMLRGLARGHLATQRLIDDGGILPLLHALEGVSGENGIGAMAENLLDTLSDKENNGDGFLGSKVLELRHATRNEMRQRALRKREEMLQVLGMRQELSSDGGERIVLAKSSIEGLEDVIEEEIDGLACMVCREGYTLRPNDMLGVYSFSKRVNLGAGSSGSTRGECVYTTVSHFNIIHFQCHQEAKRADAALKNPKKEWEGATLRNNETLCNCIFPLRGPSVPISQYIRCVDLYWDNLNVLGRADGSRLRLLTYDIVLMLARFATGASFSADSKGGGKESNSRLLPFMIQMACYLLDQGNSSQQRQSMAKSISAYLSPLIPGTDSPSRSTSFSAGRASSGSSDDTVQFMMVNSLLSESYDEWSQHLSIFLQRGIYHAYMQHTHGRSTLRVASDVSTSSNKSTSRSGTQPADSSKLFSIIQPMLVYTGLIEQMQRFFKVSKSNSPAFAKESEVGSSTVSLEKWEVLMRERLLNVKEMLGLSKELLAWLDDMTTAVDLQEAFDIMGALGVVFSGGFSTCDEFVQAAIDSGKN